MFSFFFSSARDTRAHAERRAALPAVGPGTYTVEGARDAVPIWTRLYSGFPVHRPTGVTYRPQYAVTGYFFVPMVLFTAWAVFAAVWARCCAVWQVR